MRLWWTRAPAVRRATVLALLAWLVVEAAKIYPFHLAYFNEFIGGPGNGYRYLTDSNLDWGQDLEGLATYLQRNGIAKVKVWISRTDDPRMFGIAFEPLVPGQPTTGHIAVGATALGGTEDYPGCVRAVEWLRRYEPVAKIGYSIFVYHILPTEHLPSPTALPECKFHHPSGSLPGNG
jgi:hypothetical protein